VEAEQALRVANGDGFAVEQATWLVAANKAMDQLRTFGADLGLSPAARKKLDMALPEKHWLNTFAS
jgi:phage terminase small subunit